MTFRRSVYSLLGVVALCSAVMANPPSRTLPEGRELDPVARDFFGAPPSANEPAPSRPVEKPTDTVSDSFLSSLWDSFYNSLTIPLGTVQPRLAR
jgi:hypothetical protein